MACSKTGNSSCSSWTGKKGNNGKYNYYQKTYFPKGTQTISNLRDII